MPCHAHLSHPRPILYSYRQKRIGLVAAPAPAPRPIHRTVVGAVPDASRIYSPTHIADSLKQVVRLAIREARVARIYGAAPSPRSSIFTPHTASRIELQRPPAPCALLHHVVIRIMPSEDSPTHIAGFSREVRGLVIREVQIARPFKPPPVLSLFAFHTASIIALWLRAPPICYIAPLTGSCQQKTALPTLRISHMRLGSLSTRFNPLPSGALHSAGQKVLEPTPTRLPQEACSAPPWLRRSARV